MLHGKKIILGVTGGIAAYKAVEILRQLTRRGADVYVVMTRNAQQFINPLTFQVLSNHRVSIDMFDPEREMEIEHVSLAREADLVLLAPATANFLAKLSVGLADDLLSTLCTAARCPFIIAPSMNDWMYTNPAVQANLKLLRRRGIRVIEPESGYLACETIGKGRLPALETIVAEVETALGSMEDCAGLKIVVTGGPTREAIDPVRYISNRSSGKMGIALARRARDRGAEVILILGPSSLDPPPGVATVQVQSAREMAIAAMKATDSADIFISTAAVADYTPARKRTSKIKKSPDNLALELKPTVDILKTIAGRRPGLFLVGFAAESGNPVVRARRKMKRKKVDLMAANDISRSDSGFAVDTIKLHLLHGKTAIELPLLPKDEAADRILDRVLFLRSQHEHG